MSVVRRWRKTFSSSTTQLSLMSGCEASKVFESFCMRIMSLLFTVAMVTVSPAWQSRAKEIPADRNRTLGSRIFYCCNPGWRTDYNSYPRAQQMNGIRTTDTFLTEHLRGKKVSVTTAYRARQPIRFGVNLGPTLAEDCPQ